MDLRTIMLLAFMSFMIQSPAKAGEDFTNWKNNPHQTAQLLACVWQMDVLMREDNDLEKGRVIAKALPIDRARAWTEIDAAMKANPSLVVSPELVGQLAPFIVKQAREKNSLWVIAVKCGSIMTQAGFVKR